MANALSLIVARGAYGSGRVILGRAGTFAYPYGALGILTRGRDFRISFTKRGASSARQGPFQA